MPTNHRNTPGPNVSLFDADSPEVAQRALPAKRQQRHRAAASSRRGGQLGRRGTSGSGRRAHCWPSATAAAAPMISSATQTGPSGGVGAAARIGSAGMSPPNTVNELNVANPTWALEPTAIADVPTITFGAYRTDSTVRLNCPNSESVIANRSCIVDQCTTSDAAVAAADSPVSASTPATAARTASGSHPGSGVPASAPSADLRSHADRRPDPVHRQHAEEGAQRARRLQLGEDG